MGMPRSTVSTYLRWVSLVVAQISPAYIILLVLTLLLALLFLTLLWFSCDQDIIKFGESLNNYMSIILGLILMAQVWIVYQQYRHMKQPFFKASLLWTLSKSNSDTDCCILLKNGGTAPIFNISYRILKVLVKDRWGYKEYKKIKSEEISEYFLPRLDGGFEKEILEKPIEEFEKMRLAVYISAKTLDGHSTRLFFYKAPEDVDFRLAGNVHT